jgi:inhibitor of cysteine peptidase
MRKNRTPPRAGAVGALAASLLLAGCAAAPIAGSAPAQPADGGPRAFDLRSVRIDVRQGETFELRLPSTPSTGYRWELVDPVPEAVRPVQVSRSDPARGDLVGAPTQEAWTFQAARAGAGTLGFVFRRPLDPPAVAPAQRASFRIEVR